MSVVTTPAKVQKFQQITTWGLQHCHVPCCNCTSKGTKISANHNTLPLLKSTLYLHLQNYVIYGAHHDNEKKELAVGCPRKRQKVRQFPAAFGTEMHENAWDWGQKRRGKEMKNTENVGFILHPVWILHPILHPKFPMYKGNFMDGCRKCRRKLQNFF